MTETERTKATVEFAKRWSGKGYEKGESQKFWIDLLMNVYGVEQPTQYMQFEVPILLDHTSFIDVYIPDTKVIIEQKSIGKDLKKAIKQSDGTFLTPTQQMLRYANAMNYDVMPRWGISCNFQEFMIFDFNNKHGEPEVIKLKDLPKEYHRLDFLVAKDTTHVRKEVEISIAAGKIVSIIYDELKSSYKTDDESTLRSLNILCVRLIFCLYAEDAGIFTKDQFYHYMKQFKSGHFRKELINLFTVLNTPLDERDMYLEDDLAAFPYVNGGLFAGEIVIPQFSPTAVEYILEEASLGFNWKHISPTIFGAVFESTLSTKLRRAGGMHYTSIENIHKVIDPLFLDSLYHEFDNIMEIKQEKSRRNLLEKFHDKIANLIFFDPACGSGNFLTETYISIRRLENRLIEALYGIEITFDFASPIKVSINQFYGIEINDFAVSVARTALWIAEYQMMEETRELVFFKDEFLPLKSYANIVEGNALRMDWNEVVPADRLKYIMGNPPFLGYSLQSKEQKNDMLSVYVDENGKSYKTAGKIDYVAGWYFKAAALMVHSDNVVRTAFVSTNSITQGEQVAGVWKPLYDRFDIHIDFAWRTFKWASQSSEQAAVHVVIVGFSHCSFNEEKHIFSDGRVTVANNISPYLIDMPNVFIESRNKPICKIPQMTTGNRPADGGHLIIEAADYAEFIKREPKAEKYIKKLIGAKEFINGLDRYCLWLVNVSPAEIKKMPLVMERIRLCKEDRENAPDVGRRKLADTPHLFREQKNPEKYMIVPRVSSENRKYIPLGFLDSNTVPTDSATIVINSELYHFGILSSNIHMIWMRTVAGRLKSDYRYSKDIVYNNFPWCTPTDEQKTKIEKTAQAILDARALYPDCSLADLYDDLTMPPELRKAHQANDKAVMEAYGFYKQKKGKSVWFTASECVAALMKMYQDLINIPLQI